jgi:hypothetical protein
MAEMNESSEVEVKLENVEEQGNDEFTLAEKLKAAEYYERKRISGREFYKKNKDKCLEYTRKRREKQREERKAKMEQEGELGVVKEKVKRKRVKSAEAKDKERAYARKRYSDEETKQRTAERQKMYRLRRKRAYLALTTDNKEVAGDAISEEASVEGPEAVLPAE